MMMNLCAHVCLCCFLFAHFHHWCCEMKTACKHIHAKYFNGTLQCLLAHQQLHTLHVIDFILVVISSTCSILQFSSFFSQCDAKLKSRKTKDKKIIIITTIYWVYALQIQDDLYFENFVRKREWMSELEREKEKRSVIDWKKTAPFSAVRLSVCVNAENAIPIYLLYKYVCSVALLCIRSSMIELLARESSNGNSILLSFSLSPYIQVCVYLCEYCYFVFYRVFEVAASSDHHIRDHYF